MSGQITVVGIGPGHALDRTKRAEIAIKEAEVVIGYDLYLNHIQDLLNDKIIISSGMTKEIERCRITFQNAKKGYKVVVVSSGDAGIYGMAGLILEMGQKKENLEIPIEIIPGISAANAAAALLGAPLMLDWACISLSDLLVDWSIIKSRLTAIAMSDLVVAIYNPKSKKRYKQLEEAVNILLEHRSKETPVGICSYIGSINEEMTISTLNNLCEQQIGMRSVIIVGNSTSFVKNNKLITPRGYAV